MIISASRRTDIPAFYAKWFGQRLRKGFVQVRNPMNFRQVANVTLSPENVECIVFWTKNPKEIFTLLPEIEDLGYCYYFLFTLTAYDKSIEQNVPDLEERVAVFHALAAQVGSERVIWRYDPILFTDCFSTGFHRQAFARLARSLAGATNRCVVSFLQMYDKCERNMKGLTIENPQSTELTELLSTLQGHGASHGITLQTCAERSALAVAGIPSGKCIDDRLISKITGTGISAKKDKNQRSECGCIESIDIGAYNSCPHRCLYCYANSNTFTVAKNYSAHDPLSPLLYGTLQEADTVTDRPVKKLVTSQLRLF